ncbi:MAG: SDR family NAD(P)-dependent oxidoreductase [Pirellulaceae bacterium]
MAQSDTSELGRRLGSLSPAKRQLLEKALRGETSRCEPIAIVGLGCRFAGAASPQSFWKLLCERRVATGLIPPSRWDAEAFYDPSGQTPGKMANRWGGFVADVDQFDPLFFGISPREAENMDPQQRLLLEVAWEALEYGAIAPRGLAGSRTGTFVGIGAVDYSRIPAQMEGYFERINLYSGTGNALSIAANRLSYVLDLRGPSLSVDTACSSALVAVHLAVQSLRSGECDAALAGGCNLILSPESTLAFSKAQMLSPDGVCRPFDARANGYVRGEGCGILVLKRLTHAVAQGNRVFAVIRGTAVNQDGRTSGIAAPNPLSQQAVIRTAFENAGVRAADVSYLEAHGTGTPLGDPMEWEALAEVFREDPSAGSPCYVGSVKGNVGHTETAAGAAGLIKTVLMMQSRQIPPQASFAQLNPRIVLDGTRLAVAEQLRDWQPGGPRIAGISAFGFGGTNAHVVMEEAPQPEERLPAVDDRPHHVLTLSAKSEAALANQATGLACYLDEHKDVALGDVCFSQNVGRSQFEHRLAVVAETHGQLQQRLISFGRSETAETASDVFHGRRSAVGRAHVAFLFSGQGCQYPLMGRCLFETEPVFRDALRRCDELFEDALDVPLLALLHRQEHAERLNHTRYLQPALFGIQYALAELWRSWGIVPDVVLGHSVGEFAAACVAEVLDVEDASRLVAERARLMSELPQNGSMAVVFADEATVSQKMKMASESGGVSVAALNGPENTVISGTTELIDRMMAEWKAEGIRCQKLSVSHAFHSPLMEPMLDAFRDYAEMLDYEASQIPFISTVTGESLEGTIADGQYWTRQVRSPVQFVKAVHRLAECEPEIVLEIGPSATAIAMAQACRSPMQPVWLTSLGKGNRDNRVALRSLAEMYVRGVDVDWESHDRPWPRQRLVLPTYPFERKGYWHPGVIRTGSEGMPVICGASLHPLLGARVPSAAIQRIFAVSLGSRKPAYLADHQIRGSVVMPAAGYVEQGLAAAACLLGQGLQEVENLSIQQAMVLTSDSQRSVQTLLTAETRDVYRFNVYSRQAEEGDGKGSDEPGWTLHASGTVRSAESRNESEMATPPPLQLDEVIGKATHHLLGEQFYGRLAEHGLMYGPTFRVIEKLHVTGGAALGSLAVAPSVAGEADAYQIHPALLDGGLQTIAGILAAGSADSTGSVLYLPTLVRRARVFRRAAVPAWAYAVCTSKDAVRNAEVIEADVFLLDQAGEVLVELSGVCLQRVGPAGTGGAPEFRNWVYRLQWLETDNAPGATTDQMRRETDVTHWLLLADEVGVGERLASQLCRRGSPCTLVRSGERFQRLEGDGRSCGPVYEIDPVAKSDYERLLAEWRPPEAARCGIVHLWNLDLDLLDASDAAFLEQVRSRGCASVLQLLHGLRAAWPSGSPELFLVTRGAQYVQEDDVVSPAQSASWGLGRVAANEHPELAWRLVDLDPANDPTIAGRCLERELFAERDETQIAYRSEKRWVARLQRDPDAIDFAASAKRPIALAGPRRLQVGNTGTFDSLFYSELERPAPGPAQVEIEVRSAGLNFSDVLKAMGLYPGITDRVVPMGIECSGIVSALGEGVERFHVGDAVMGVAPYSFASHAITAEYALVNKPESFSDDEAATIPIAFLTAYYALCRLAHLGAGERVLIHAGAGGVGLAAIQIAQDVGAEIFTTAGSDEKRDYLRALGVEHVMNSRTLEFAEQIMKITEGRGVDVVLNSLPGSAIEKSLSVLGSYGRFLEIGKIDIYQNRMIGLLPFQNNLSYFAIDLDRMLRQRPDEIRALFAELMDHFRGHAYRPLPVTCFRDDKVRDAFRYMAQRKNIGKIVVTFHERGSAADETSKAAATVRQDGTYLVTGGCGAFGLQVARRLARQGAKFLALLGRRPPGEAAAGQIQELRDRGIEVVILRGNVADRKSIERALEQIPRQYPPLRGVFHAAGVLADALLHEMDLETLDKGLAPKIAGAWNVHQATVRCALDHFVLFSSVAGLLGSPGQANYAAGNTFLDGLAHYRRAQALPAVSISWGPVSFEPSVGAGMAATVQEQLEARGMKLLSAEDALQLLEAALAGAPPHLMVAAVDWNKLLGGTRGALSQFAAHLRSDDGTTAGWDEVDEALCRQLRNAEPERRMALLCECIAAEVAVVMEIAPNALDREQPLASLGLDSLMAMELKAKLEAKLGQSMPMGALLENPSVARLAAVFAPFFSPTSSGSQAPVVALSATARSLTHGWSPLLKLTDRGARPPLICVHPAGGDVSCYYSLARRLGAHFPVWALRARGLDEQTAPHQSVETMAQDYLEAIRAEHPPSPYYLAGWSTGGIFAYEMTRQLLGQPDEAAGLFLFDSPTPAIFQGVDLEDASRFLVDLVEFSNWFAGSRMQVDYEDLKTQTPDAALRIVFDEAKRHHVLSSDSSIEYLRRLVSVCREHSRAIVQYPLRPLDRPVHLFRPANSRVLADASRKTLSEDLGWREILGEQLVIRQVPGDHFSMMTEENAGVLGDRILDQLEALNVL